MTKERVAKVPSDLICLPKISLGTYHLFVRLTSLFRRFIDFDDARYFILSVLYVLLTHVYSIFDQVPYLQVFGQWGSGKSLLGDLLGGLCFNAFNSSEISDAALYRVIGAGQAYGGGLTMILDEQEDLSVPTRRGILFRVLRSGYRWNGSVTRCDSKRRIERFSTFCPKIILNEKGIGDRALESRTISLPMIKSERPLEEFRFSIVQEEFKEIKELIRSFSKDYYDFVSGRYASFKGVDGLSGRDKEVWAPIIIIAEVLATLLDAPYIKEDMLALAKEAILQRQRTQLIGDLDSQILEATRAYVEQAEPVKSDGVHLFVGEDLATFIRDRWSNAGLQLETVSRVIKRHGVILEIRRPRLPSRDRGSMVQRTCYLIDQERLAKLTSEYF